MPRDSVQVPHKASDSNRRFVLGLFGNFATNLPRRNDTSESLPISPCCQSVSPACSRRGNETKKTDEIGPRIFFGLQAPSRECVEHERITLKPNRPVMETEVIQEFLLSDPIWKVLENETICEGYARRSGAALGGEEDPVHRTRSGLQYNTIAIAFVGTVLLLRNRFEMTDVRALLEAAGSGNPAAAQGFAAGLLAVLDERLPRTLLRCGFCGCIQPERRWDMPEEDYKARLEARRQEVRAVIDAEIAWLEGKQNEPAWPAFETIQAESRHHYSFSARRTLREERETRPERYTDHQAAARRPPREP